MRHLWLLVSLAALTACVAGCGTLPTGRAWGADVDPLRGQRSWGHAATAALVHPATWAPLAGALVLQIDGWDARASHWGVAHTPLFGSTETAGRWSDDLRLAALLTYAATALATPSGPEPGAWIVHKAQGVAIGGVARIATYGGIVVLKHQTHRLRPDQSNHLSLPSGHAGGASVMATMAARNASHLDAPGGVRRGIQSIAVATALGTAWARVEANKHYTSDVLVGLALGHVVGAFMDDVFLGSGVNVRVGSSGAQIRVPFD